MASNNDPLDVKSYSRQMLVPGIGRAGQLCLNRSRVLVVGCGGIGSTVIMYLAGAGVSLTLCDDDDVEASNLHRQIVHDATELGQNKAESAARRARGLHSSGLSVQVVPERLSAKNARLLVRAADLVVDATDNYESRYLLSDACVLERRALVSGSAVGLEGQVTLFDNRDAVVVATAAAVAVSANADHTRTMASKGPCYRCLYPSPNSVRSCKSCADAGVLGPVPGLVGCLQAVEAIKWLLLRDPTSDAAQSASAAGMKSLCGRQLMFDAFSGQFHSFTLAPRRATCAVCGDVPLILDMEASLASLQPQSEPQHGADADLKNTKVKEAVPEVTAIEYARLMQAGTAHLLLDVRSPLQFDMVNLKELDIAAGTHRQVLNVPLAVLRGGKSGGEVKTDAQVEQSQRAVQAVEDTRASIEAGAGTSTNIYVLCRRGVDSVTATALLRRAGLQSVFNIKGGLASWSGEVDPHFPVY